MVIMLRGTRSIALCALSLTTVIAVSVPALHASEVPALPTAVQLVRTLAKEALDNSGSAELAQVVSDMATASLQATFFDVLSDTSQAEPTTPTMVELLSAMEDSNAAVTQDLKLDEDVAQDVAQDRVDPRLLQLIEARMLDLSGEEQQEPTRLPTVLPVVDTAAGQSISQLAVSDVAGLALVLEAPPVTNSVGAPGRSTEVVTPVTAPLTPQETSVQESAKAYSSYMSLASAVIDATGLQVEPLLLAAEWSRTTHQRRVAVFSALAFFGADYVAAATGPEEFDCSGLTLTAWGKAGVTLTHWSAAQQTEVTATTVELSRVGDLAFFEGGLTAGGALNIGHVVIVLSPGLLIESSPSRGVWVTSFDAKREPVAWGSPAA